MKFSSTSTQTQKPFISIIIPCYNEEKNLKAGLLNEVHQYLSHQDFPYEVIVVDDGSTDGSRNLVERFVETQAHAHLLSIPHAGKPVAVWTGIQKAKGEIVLFTDMDQSTPIHELDALLPWYDEGFDVVIGSRRGQRRGFSFIRRIGSVAFRNLRRLILLRDIYDTQCGFKSCRRNVAAEIFPRLQYFEQKSLPSGWKVSAYDVEFLFLVQKVGYQIKEVGVSWVDRDRSDTKGPKGDLIRYMQESIEMAKEVLRVKWNQITGRYNTS